MAGRRRRDLETWRWRKLRLEILDRDHYICQLCGRPISRRVPACTTWAPSVDHIISPEIDPELEYQPQNLRAAHFGCNASRKQGRPQPKASRQWL